MGAMMRLVPTFLLILACCLGLAQEPVKVVGITDGDTLTILTKEKSEVKVRLDGIDAPEAKQPFGSASKKWLSDKLFGRTVLYQAVGKDRYGRSLGRFWLDGKRINYQIVQAGMAWWYRKYSDDPVLKQCEWEARKAKRGIWSQPVPVAPWDWRNDGRSSASQRAYGRSTVKPSSGKKIAGTVYVTATGSRHHRAGCRFLKQSAMPMSKADAAKFYKACEACGGG